MRISGGSCFMNHGALIAFALSGAFCAEYLDHREKKLAQIARVLFHKLPEARWRSVAKELMIALGFGSGFADWTSKVLQNMPLASDEGERGEVAAWLCGFETAARLFRVVFELLPQKAKDWHMEQGRSTALETFTLYAHHERSQMEKMAAAAGRTFNDHQHDGIERERGREASRGCRGGRAQAGGPVGVRGSKVPYLDWRLKSKMEFSEYYQLLHAALALAACHT